MHLRCKRLLGRIIVSLTAREMQKTLGEGKSILVTACEMRKTLGESKSYLTACERQKTLGEGKSCFTACEMQKTLGEGFSCLGRVSVVLPVDVVSGRDVIPFHSCCHSLHREEGLQSLWEQK